MADTKETIFDVKVNYSDAISKIAELKGKIDEVKQAQQDFKAQLAAGQITQEQYNKAMAASKIAADTYKTAVKDVEKAVKNQIKQEQEQEGSLKSLRAQLSNATAAYDSMSRAEREGAAGKALQEHINKITDELKTAEEETQRYYRNVGNYKNAITSALGINNGFAASILALGQNAKTSQKLMQNATDSVKAFGTALQGLLTNPLFLAIAGVAGAAMAFKWWYDYNTGLQEASKLTQEFTGKQGDEMKEFRNEVSAVADTYGKDFKEVLSTADTLASQFGITIDEALDTMKDGFVAGADEQGEFLSNLDKFPAAFKEAGLSAQQFTALAAQTQSGVFSDKGLEAIKQANSRIKQMSSSTASSLKAIGIDSDKVLDDLKNGSTTTFEVLQDVAGRLKELPQDSQEVADALVNVFGKQGRDAGLTMIESLSDINTNLDEVKQQTGELGSLEEQQMQSQLDLQNAMSGLFDMTGGTFEEMKTKAMTFVNEGLASIINGVKSVVDWFKNLYNESVAIRMIFTVIGDTFKTVYTVISSLVTLIIGQFKAWGELIEGIFTLDFDKIKKAWTDGLSNIGKMVQSWADRVRQNILNIFGAAETPKKTTTETENKTTNKTTNVTQSIDLGTVDNGGGSSSTASSTSSTDDLEKKYQKEQQIIQKYEDTLISMIADAREKQRVTINVSYDRQIADLKKQLETETDLTETGRQAINDTITALEKKRGEELNALADQQLQDEIAYRQKLLETRIAAVQKGSEEEYQLQLELLDTQREQELSDETLTQEMRTAIVEKYAMERLELVKQHQADQQQAIMDAIEEHYQAEFEAIGNNEYQRTQLELQMEQEKLDAMQQLQDESDEDYQRRLNKQNSKVQKIQQKAADQEVKIQQAKADAVSKIMNSLSSVFEAFGENSKTMARIGKIVALGEIAVNTGKAIAEATAQAQKEGWPKSIPTLATMVATIMANIATAISTVKSAKFAEGGLVTGEGTGTSDSIAARLSNGESVMTASTTSMFAPILSALNQMGGGVPISVKDSGNNMEGEEMLAHAVALGVQDVHPIVSVEEINKVSSRVRVLETRGQL